MWTKKQVAATIDHAVLKPFATDKDIIEGCNLGKEYGVASVCVRPSDVPLAKKLLDGSGVAVSVVIGFPHGAHRPEVKALEARLAIEDGAEELDMVMNIGQFLSGNFDLVEYDICGVVEAAKPKGAIVKVILETCYLSPEQIAQACRIAASAGADYVKTSTGFGDGPATPETVAIMLQTVGDVMGVKASGGIRSYATAAAYLDQGCKRLGVAATKAVLDGAPE
jgi:deoxyribose-phosphate aldolase